MGERWPATRPRAPDNRVRKSDQIRVRNKLISGAIDPSFGEAVDMREMTKQFLLSAFAGESQAHMRYLIFAERAEEEGLPNVARLFRAIAYAEFVHAKNHLSELNMVGNTRENLQKAIDGETFEVQEMYPAYHEVARLQGEQGAMRSTHYALEAEKIHSALYAKARHAVLEGRDVEVGKVYICPVCGYTVEGEAPERCPICGASRERFKEF